MASWLVLDWDNDHFQMLCAQSSRRGLEVTRAVAWPHPEPLTAASADRVGKALHDFLKAEKIPQVPVIVGLGRDRIFLKELKFPPVAAHEEAALVRFQTGKEMAEPVDNYAIDYADLDASATERRIMTVAVRKEIIATIQTLCQSAGVKLHAVTPRLFGVQSVLARGLDPEPSPLEPKRLNAVLTVGRRWGELCFFKGDRLLQAQALANGARLPAEVKRSLAVFAAQHAADSDVSGPATLYVFADDANTVQDLDAGQPLPISAPDALKNEPALKSAAGSSAAFAGAVGLAGVWSGLGKRPVNLMAPKRTAAPASAAQRSLVIYGAAAAVGLFVMVGCMWYSLNDRQNAVAALQEEQKQMKTFLDNTSQERADLDEYRNWEQSTVPWLDELYDLSARYPFKEGFRVNQLSAATTASAGAKKGPKDGVGRISLSGIFPSKSDGDYVNQLYKALDDKHLSPAEEERAGTTYRMKIDIRKQDAKNYTTVLVPPPVIRSVSAVAPKQLGPADKKGAEPMPPPAGDKMEPDDDDDGGSR